MRKKTPIERRKARILTAQRALINLKYRLMAAEELDSVLPETAEEFDRRVAAGDLPMLKASLDDVLGLQ